jgi:proprotein convertase subtilisin/kexin type 5
LNPDNICRKTCPVREYWQNTTNNECNSCEVGCEVCVGSATNCTACDHTYHLNTPANTCTLECVEGLYADGRDRKCKECNPSCKSCTTSRDNNCDTCNKTFYLNPNKACETTCPNEYYKKDPELTCNKCYPGCKHCTSAASNACTSCIPTYIHFADTNTCISATPDNFYAAQHTVTGYKGAVEAEQDATLCHANCRKCTAPGEFQCQ